MTKTKETFSIITDYEALTNSIEEAILVGEIGLGYDEKEVTRATLSTVLGHLSKLVQEHRKNIKECYSSIGITKESQQRKEVEND